MTPEQALMKATAMNDANLVAALQNVDSSGESWEWAIRVAAAKRIVDLRNVIALVQHNSQFLRRDGLFEAARLIENAFGDKHAGHAIRALAKKAPPQ